MILVERHIIKRSNSNWREMDRLCYLSKNLYNYSLYKIKKYFEETGKFYYYNLLEKELRTEKHETYRNLPVASSQQILIRLDKNFRSFFQLLKKWKKDKKTLKGCPNPPKYKDKIKGRNLVIFTNQQVKMKGEYICFPKKANLKPIKTKVNNVQQIRIIPQTSCYVLEIVYEKEIQKNENLNKDNYLAIDLGVNNIVTIVSNLPGIKPVLINGRIIKSKNQFYNKIKAKVQSHLEKNHKKKTSKRLNNILLKRNNYVFNYLHHVSKFVVSFCLENNIKTVVIGKNENWKQECDMGKRNNQNFLNIPHTTLIEQIKYKAEFDDIIVIIKTEEYTSKCSALDLEEIEKHENYLGKRIKRGLFKSLSSLINSDVNGALNILRKEIGDDFINLLNRGCVLQPIKVNPL